MKDTSKKALRRGHNEGNIRQRTDGRWEVRLSAGIDYKTGKPRRTSTCCNTRQEAIAILQQQAHEVRTQGWRDPMSVTLGEWYEYWLDTYMKDTVKQSTYASYRSYLNKHFCVLGKILLKKLEPHTLQEFYNYKFREEGLSPKTLRNYHMALHKCLQQAVKERLLVYNPCDAVTLPSGEKPEISVFTNDQQRALVQASYRHRYGVFIRLDLCTGLRMGELLALKWEDIDFSIRIFKGGYTCRLFPDAWVYHKRRTDMKKFFKQVHNSGIARINLYKKYPDSLKLVHLLPAVFTLGVVVLLLGTPFCLFSFTPIILYGLLVCLDSTIQNKSLHIGVCSISAAFIQLIGYGTGFWRAWWQRCVRGKDEFEAFRSNFYK